MVRHAEKKNAFSASSNNLPPGVSEQMVLDAAIASGYPLQHRLADSLSAYLDDIPYGTMQEEWAYVDDDTQAVRTLDVMFKVQYDRSDRIYAGVTALIECKQSQLPYVFFRSKNSSFVPDFPMLAGLRKYSLELTVPDSRSVWLTPLNACLGLLDHPFVREPQRTSHNFSKCVRKGDVLELSGSDAYQSIVLPLLKAARHFRRISRPTPISRYYDLTAAVPVAVVDAPMFIVSQDAEPSLRPVGWVRVIRHESREGRRQQSERTVAVDIVHAGFVQQYFDDYLMPFSRIMREVVARHEREILEGKAFVDNAARLFLPGAKTEIRALTPRERLSALQRDAMVYLSHQTPLRKWLN